MSDEINYEDYKSKEVKRDRLRNAQEDVKSDIVVCKFGGTSVSNAYQIAKIEQILKENNERKFVVVSAPGKDPGFKYKVTDLLYNLHFKVNNIGDDLFNYEKIDLSKEVIQEMIIDRYSNISHYLEISAHSMSELKEKLSFENISENTIGQTVSMGEYFSAKIIAEYLNAEFADAASLIKLRKDGTVIMNSTIENINKLNSKKGIVVIPGFYGSTIQTEDILTFSRGGSDFTGSLVAAGVNAKLYENWTDRDGIYACDPRLFSENELNGKKLFVIPKMSYKETRELTYMGFEVFNDESIGPLVQKNIPLLIKNTNNLFAPGTLISNEYDESIPVRGIAGKNGFCSITLEKYLMNKTVGFGANLLNIMSDYGINYEHSPSGIDSMSVVIEQKAFSKYKKDIMEDIQNKLAPDNISIRENLGLVAVVGEGMKRNLDITSKIMNSLSEEKIHVELISQGASENNLILGINSQDYKRAIKALYGDLINTTR